MAVIRTVASLVFFGSQIAAWVILLAGVAASHKSCVDVNKPKTVVRVDGRRLMSHGRELMGYAEDVCNTQMSLSWWITWFQFAIILLAMLVASSGFMARFSNAIVAFFVSVTTIMMYNASVANDQIFSNKDSNNSDVKDYVAGLRAALAGMVMLMVLNFIYIVCNTEESCSLVFHLGCGSPRTPASSSIVQTNTEALPKAAPTTPSYPNGSVPPATV